jgi:hypothetical protein
MSNGEDSREYPVFVDPREEPGKSTMEIAKLAGLLWLQRLGRALACAEGASR